MRPAAFVRVANCSDKVMKTIIHAFLFLILFAPLSRAMEQSVLARVTVYWASGGRGSDRWTRQHVCSTGQRLRVGHCAVDPRRIPYGSKVTFPDGTLVAVDTGSAVRNRKAARLSGRNASERNAVVIDRFFETKQQALNWARRNPYFMFVRISPPDFRSGSSFAQPRKTAQSVSMNPAPASAPAPLPVASAPRPSPQVRPVRRAGWMP
jgi:3D (Asp-Asp-Asp) domain-containing protein